MINRRETGDCREVMRRMIAEGVKVQMCVTSPPYWGLRDYGTGMWEGGDDECDHKAPPTGGPNPVRYTDGGAEMFRAGNDKLYSGTCAKCGAHRIDQQIGLEKTPEEFIATMVEVFRLVREVLAEDGVLFLNMGDAYASEARRGARQNGKSCKEQPDCIGPDSSCSGLCDGCAAALESRNTGSNRPGHGASLQDYTKARDTLQPDFVSAFLAASLPDVQASTSLECAPQPPGECSHCANCGACLAVLRSSSRDARLCGRKGAYMSDSGEPVLGAHNRGMDVSGTAWVNYKAKDLMGLPWRVAFALQADGWYLRSDIIWHKPNPMPESVQGQADERA